MRVLYWGQHVEDFRAAFDAALAGRGADVVLLWESDADGLRRALAVEHHHIHLVALAPANLESLRELRCLQAVLSGLPVIVLLPSDTPEAVEVTHEFYPRFVASIDEGLPNAAIVAANIVLGGKHNGEGKIRNQRL